MVQQTGARIDKHYHITPTLKPLHWLLGDFALNTMHLLTFNSLHGFAILVLRNLCIHLFIIIKYYCINMDLYKSINIFTNIYICKSPTFKSVIVFFTYALYGYYVT